MEWKLNKTNKMKTLEEIKQKLIFYAAHLALESDYSIEEVCKLFDELMQNGIYSPELLDIYLVDLKYINHFDFAKLFELGLKSVDIPLFSDPEKAKAHIIHYHLDRVVNQNVNSYEEIGVLFCSLYGGFLSEEFEFFGEASNIIHAYYYYAEDYLAEYRSKEEQKKIDDELLALAQEAIEYYR